jgi:hypothetical protein
MIVSGIGSDMTLAAYGRSPRRRPRPMARRASALDAGERVEIEDALAAIDLDDDRWEDGPGWNGLSVTAAAVARRLAASADRAIAAQARLGGAAVRRLVEGER